MGGRAGGMGGAGGGMGGTGGGMGGTGGGIRARHGAGEGGRAGGVMGGMTSMPPDPPQGPTRPPGGPALAKKRTRRGRPPANVLKMEIPKGTPARKASWRSPTFGGRGRRPRRRRERVRHQAFADRDYDPHTHKNSDATPAQLYLDLSFLKSRNLFVDIEKALKAYLKYRPKFEPWMYETLALVVEINSRTKASEVKNRASGGRASSAAQTHDVNSMIRVGDLLLARKIYDVTLTRGAGSESIHISPGDLFDQAGRRAIHRPELLLFPRSNSPCETEDPEADG